ncbi:unnamed protein product [Trifolium pratense]|uniref:Uncharacterized protein n=1 Tax=Trifolium pratense TaxID=57577 RepID=A0ACB0JJT9_TRIPR|nr:unnamed protein product [Trifolium pratense]
MICRESLIFLSIARSCYTQHIAVEHSNYLRCRVTTSALPFGPIDSSTGRATTPMSAYTAMSKGIVHLNSLKIFGCAAYPLKLSRSEGPQKFESRIQGEEYIFIGMKGNSIFKIMHRKIHTIIVPAECKFTENLFRGLDPPKSKAGATQIPNLLGIETGVNLDSKMSQNISIKIQGATPASSSVEPNHQNVQSRRKSSKEAKEGQKVREDHDQITPQAHQQVEIPLRGDYETANKLAPSAVVTRSGRTVKPKIKSFYASHNKAVYGHEILNLAQSLSAVQIDGDLESQEHEVFTEIIIHLFENIDIDDALKGEDSELWKQSLKEELQALKETNTYQLCEKKENMKLISSKWVCRYKWNQDGLVARRNSRLVARGFEKTYGSDYLETFATVVRYSTLRTLLSVAAAENLEINHVDVNTAFLNPKCTKTFI